ncbi:hypothetical protein WOC76_00845 [Methylocystis sp. IM3]
MALRHIETEIEIEAPADRIWALLIRLFAPQRTTFCRLRVC